MLWSVTSFATVKTWKWKDTSWLLNEKSDDCCNGMAEMRMCAETKFSGVIRLKRLH